MIMSKLFKTVMSLPPEIKQGLKIAVFDLETTGLRMDYGKIICGVIYDVNLAKLFVHRIDSYGKDIRDDKSLVRDIILALNSYDMVIGWYSSRADFRWLNTRALKHNLQPPVKNYRRDLWETCRRNFSLRNNRLQTAHDFFFGHSNKTKITPEIWEGLMHGDKKAMNYVVKHCKIDVMETFDLYRLFWPLFPNRLRK